MMDAYKHLSLEYAGIRDVIFNYTSQGAIANHVKQLEQAIDAADLETIRYTLSAIKDWYDANIERVMTNDFVGDSSKDEHHKIRALIRQLLDEFQDYEIDPQIIASRARHIETPNDKLIFLSHKSDDRKYGDALRNFIVGLGVKNDQLIYTSHALHKTPLDQNIYEYLRNHLGSNVFVIILWSDRYLESPACLNEMGAAWVAKSDYTNIYVPTFSFGNPKYHECAVDTRKMGAVLNGNQHCKTSMLELKDKIQDIFDLKNDEKQVTYLLDQLLKEIGE